MTDFSDAKTALGAAIGDGLVEEYEISKDRRRVRRGSVKDQVDALARLGGLVDRQSNGLIRIGKITEASD